MRLPILITFVVFISSVVKRDINRASATVQQLHTIWNLSVARDYKLICSTQINTIDNGMTPVSVLTRKPFSYVAIGADTQRIKGTMHVGLDEPWDQIGLDEIYVSSKQFDAASITTAFDGKYIGNKNARWLMLIEDKDFSVIAPSVIHPKQLDTDKQQEMIVEAMDGWWHHYLIYDSTAAGWEFIQKLTYTDRNYWFSDVDVSLEGFFGFSSFSWGTCFGSEDRQYFQFIDGQLRKSFWISQCMYLEFWHSAHMEMYHVGSESSITQYGNRINVAQHLNIEYTLGNNMEQLHTEVFSYNLVQQSDGTYLPDKTGLGFNSSDWNDSTFFCPEEYIGALMDRLKMNGTVKQKIHLQAFQGNINCIR